MRAPDADAATPRRSVAWSLGLLAMFAASACGREPPHLHPAIAREYASFIRQGELAPPRHCGRLVEVKLDPRKIADGAPAYYDNTTGALVVRCDNPMSRHGIPPERWTVCPPAEWRCGP